jgi:predicted phage terminase large subunit-like protein
VSERELAALGPMAGAELARRRLSDYLGLLHPHYQRARHTQEICRRLEQVDRREVRRLMVLMPPRHSKTLHCSQGFPAFYLGRHPGHQVILASHTAGLAEGNSRVVQRLMQDPRSPFDVRVSRSASAVGHWETTAGGVLIAAGVGSALTGFGADLLLTDDPITDRAEADSAWARQLQWDWFTQVAMTRLMPDGVVVLVMTSWHEDDLRGRILSSPWGDEWVVLRLPALAEADDPLGRAEGEALWPERFPVEALPSVDKGQISARGFAALYQQHPTPETGGLIKRDWLEGRYTALPAQVRLIQTVDSAFKAGVANDFSVIATWATDRRHFYLVDIWRGRVEYPDLKRAIHDQYAKHAPSVILVEDAASGQSLIQDLKHETGLPIVPRRPKGSKESRVAAISGFLASRVLLPEQASFVGPWIEEHVGFRAGAPHDDQVDTTVLALEEFRSDGPRVRALIGR